MAALGAEPESSFGASILRTAVLPTDYRRSWQELQPLYAAFVPDVVVHFGLSLRAESIHVERRARNAVAPDKPDAAEYAPSDGRILPSGPDVLFSTLPTMAIVEQLSARGFAAGLSDDAGAYVCNATLYRSLHANAAPKVGFVHVPPLSRAGLTPSRLVEAAGAVLRAAAKS